jgi:hypothetical protein
MKPSFFVLSATCIELGQHLFKAFKRVITLFSLNLQCAKSRVFLCIFNAELRSKTKTIIIGLSHIIYTKHSLKPAIFSINFVKIKRKNGKISNNFGQKKDKFCRTPLHQNETPL